MPRYQHESTILFPKDPTALEDDWPIFSLYDAIVYRPDGVTMANAILVSKEGPCIVRGRLEIDDKEDVQYLVKPSLRTAYLEARNIENYSIGDDEQGVIWLSSDSGWLEIHPHPSYEPIYRSMCDMTVLYYILLGIYTNATEQDPKNAWKLRATLDIKETLFEYAVALGDGTTYDETVDKCVRLGPMLLAHCRRATDMDWTKSSFYKWLEKEMRGRERLARSSSRGDSAMPSGQQTAAAAAVAAVAAVSTPGAVQSITQASEPQIILRSQSQTPAAVPQQLPFRAPPESAETTGADTPALSSPHDGPSLSITADAATEVPSLPIVNAVPLSSSTAVPAHLRASVFDTYLKIIERLGQIHGDPSRIAVTRLHSLLFSKHRVRSYSTVKSLSAFFSHELASKLSDAWRGSPYEKWLVSAEVRASAPTSDSFLRDIPDQLLPGVPILYISDTTASAEPTSRSYSPQTAGKRAVLRPSTISRKRRLDSPENGAGVDGENETGPKSTSQESTPQPDDRPRKVARNSQDGGVASDIEPQSMQVDIDNSTSSEDSSIDNDLESDADSKEETILAIRIEPLLVSTKPTGPNHTWTCPEPGCSFIVRGGLEASGSDEDDSEKDVKYDTNTRIQAHLYGHEQKTLSCVDLAISEGTRGRVSVDHLLAKIRTLADKATGQQSLPAAKMASSGTSTRRSRFFF
ncbi:hypothetical protein SEPCBS57363_002407 [Sporothrix epigloea]|uniref:Uncharacterized protein n=1 Tax=Sporothrix epigloea TaxID=1892477 RepID=A0ABP0DHE5_9PEZI